ncbi:MAG: efflux RND transporter periplasmic adaptor subunit [Vicinamibacterales bacterium]
MMLTNVRRSSLGALAIASACVAGCSPASTPPPASAPASTAATAAATPQGPTLLDVTSVVERPLDVTLTIPGEIIAFQSVDVAPRVTGFVKSVSVDRGSRVQPGQVLVTLEAPELVAQRAEAESKVLAAQALVASAQAKADADRGTFDRLRAASATPGVVAGNDLVVAEKAAEASRNQLASVQQAVEAARQALTSVRELEGYLRIAAPFAGVITERTVHPGALVGPSTASAPLLRLVDARRLRVVVPVPEAYITEIHEGAEVTFAVAAYPGQNFPGRVARIARAVNVTTRTMAVELDVANDDGRLVPGGFCQVAWPVSRRGPSLFVPSGSVAATTDRTFVIRVRDGKTEWVDVRTGLTAGPLVEVFGDLKAGDTVAGRGTDELRPGTPVTPRPPKPAA